MSDEDFVLDFFLRRLKFKTAAFVIRLSILCLYLLLTRLHKKRIRTILILVKMLVQTALHLFLLRNEN